LDEIQKTNLLIVELDNITIKDNDYTIINETLNLYLIEYYIDFYKARKREIEEKNDSQIKTKEQIKQTIEALNSDTELYNDLYKELFSTNSKMTRTIRDKYKTLVIEQFKKYFNIIKTLLNKNIFEILTDKKFCIDNNFNINTSNAEEYTYTTIRPENLNIQILLYIFLNVIILYKLFETIYLIYLIVDKPYNNYLILEDYIKLIKNIQDLFNDKFRDYKTKTVDYTDKISVLEKMQKEVTSLLNENGRELKSIESNITEYSANNQSKINGKDSNKKDGLVEKIKTVKASITKLNEELAKDDCERFTKIKPIFEKLTDSTNNILSGYSNLSKPEVEVINTLKRSLSSSLSSRFSWSDTNRTSSGVLIPKTTETKKISDMYNYLESIYGKKKDELNKKQQELESLESQKTTLESRISKRASDKRTFTEKIANLNALATKIDARLMKLQSKNGGSLPNFALIQQRFTGMFKVTLDITTKYKEYTRTFAFRKSKNKVWFLYDENQKQFIEDYNGLLTNIDDLLYKCNTPGRCTSKNCNLTCKSVQNLTDGLIKKMISNKSKNFLTEIEKYFKDATPIENPFFEEYKFHYESMTRKIIILLTKINKKELKLKREPDFEKIKEDYTKHTQKKINVFNKIYYVIEEHIKKIQANNNIKSQQSASSNNGKNISNKPPFIVAPYTYVLFAYFIYLLLIIDYLTFFYE